MKIDKSIDLNIRIDEARRVTVWMNELESNISWDHTYDGNDERIEEDVGSWIRDWIGLWMDAREERT